MRHLAIGDIHGNVSVLKSALTAANYNPSNDKLYFVGDYIDRHPHSKQVVDMILNLPNTVCLRGNHDQFMIDFINQDVPNKNVSDVWFEQGAPSTLRSYGFTIRKSGNKRIATGGHIPEKHKRFYNSLKGYFVAKNNVAFVHGGFDLKMEDMSTNFIIWDRLMWKTAKEVHLRGHAPYPCFKRFKKIFIGHTNLLSYPGQKECLPQKKLNVWNIDTGAGFTGPLTIMDIDSEEFWQSSI